MSLMSLSMCSKRLVSLERLVFLERLSPFSSLPLLLLALLLAACTASPSDPPAATQPEAAEVPISITLGTDFGSLEAEDGNPTTRSAPPGAATDPEDPQVDGVDETQEVNQVRIVAFRAKVDDDEYDMSARDLDNAPTDPAAYVYDPSNDQTVLCARTTASAHRLTAHATLKKLRGYAYRVVALAYSSSSALDPNNGMITPAQGEEGLFTLGAAEGTTLQDFQLRVNAYAADGWGQFICGPHNSDLFYNNTFYLSGKLAYGPQLFYATCQTQTGHSVVRFRETLTSGERSSAVPLTGVLFRGMAEVKLTYTIDSRNDVRFVALMANHVLTTVSLAKGYDAFLQPTDTITPGTKYSFGKNDNYSVISYATPADGAETFSKGTTVTLRAWVLPARTKLAVRTCYYIVGDAANGVPHNFPLRVSDVSATDQGTGIVSPDTQGSWFYLRRNHRYRLTGKMSVVTANKELK